jgi:CelD/BcsL family acetyltransferase involved in cellulose biosynthesis
MVDIGTPATAATSTVSSTANIHCDIHSGAEMAQAVVDAFAEDSICSGYQNRNFLKSWIANSPLEPVFLSFRTTGSGPVVLPLERAARNRLGYPGGRHANGNFPVGRPADIEALAQAGEAEIRGAIRGAQPGADAIFLERQLQRYAGVANPFVFESSTLSPNPALSLSLGGGFDAVLSRHSAKRRKKRFRGQERRLAGMGGYRYVPSVSPEDVAATLGAFFHMKSRRFENAGISDVFAEDHVKRFFTQLFQSGVEDDPHTHELKVLEVNGKPAAIIGCTIHDGRLTVEFGTFDETMSDIGPGDMLFFLSIREAAEKDLDFYDFGIGDEFYKRGWCEIETLHMDTVIPLTNRGRIESAVMIARNTIIRSIKRNDTVWRTIKRLRKRVPALR